MKAPICEVCLSSDMLCPACRRKVENAEVSELEIGLYRSIYKISKSFGPIREVSIKKVVGGGKTAVIMCNPGEGPRIVGKDGLMIKKLSKMVGKSLRVVESTGDVKEFIRRLIHPVPVKRINVVYMPEKEILKVIIPKGRKIPMSKASFSEIVKSLFGKEAVVRNG